MPWPHRWQIITLGAFFFHAFEGLVFGGDFTGGITNGGGPIATGAAFGGGAAFDGAAAFDGTAAFGGGGNRLNGGFGGAFGCSFANDNNGSCSVSGALCTACCVSSL